MNIEEAVSIFKNISDRSKNMKKWEKLFTAQALRKNVCSVSRTALL